MKLLAIATSLVVAASIGVETVSAAGYSYVRGGAKGTSQATRYWDCCKPSCGWNGKAKVSSPVRTCAKNGVSIIGNNVQSGCAGGGAFVCNNNQPWVVNNNLAYGFAAARIPGGGEDRWCCSCFELSFTSTAAKGKKMVVQITNTGYDAGTEKGAHFDILMPGGGVGLYNGCQPQWNSPSEGWGVRYGGVWNADMCKQLPAQLRKGCEWRFGWFKGADNPNLVYREVTCPKEITNVSGCRRL
ncbi:Putative Endo-glucanase RCE2 [Rhizopus microsporus]|nr:Putative Endo-glucanase RCE2 [Rhizopus microsporus]